MYDAALDLTRIRISPCSRADLHRFSKLYIDIDVLKAPSGNAIRQWWTNILELEETQDGDLQATIHVDEIFSRRSSFKNPCNWSDDFSRVYLDDMWQNLDGKLCTIVPALLEYWLGGFSQDLVLPVLGFPQPAVSTIMREYTSAKADSGTRVAQGYEYIDFGSIGDTGVGEEEYNPNTDLDDLTIDFSSTDITFVFKNWHNIKAKMGESSGVDYEAAFLPWIRDFEAYFNV